MAKDMVFPASLDYADPIVGFTAHPTFKNCGFQYILKSGSISGYAEHSDCAGGMVETLVPDLDQFVSKIVLTADSGDSIVRRIEFYDEQGKQLLQVGTESSLARQVRREIVLKQGERLVGIEATH